MLAVGRSIDNLIVTIVGSVILSLGFAIGACLAVWLAVAYRAVLTRAGHRSVLLVLAALPFYAARIVYTLLGEYLPEIFDPLFGDIGVIAGMELVMELIIIGILFAARAVAEPFRLVPGLPDPGLPDPGLPDPGRPGPGLPNPGLPNPGHPHSGLSGP